MRWLRLELELGRRGCDTSRKHHLVVTIGYWNCVRVNDHFCFTSVIFWISSLHVSCVAQGYRRVNSAALAGPDLPRPYVSRGLMTGATTAFRPSHGGRCPDTSIFHSSTLKYSTMAMSACSVDAIIRCETAPMRSSRPQHTRTRSHGSTAKRPFATIFE